MHPWIAATVLLGALVVEAPPQTDRARYDPAQPDAARDALGLLQHGPDYVEGVERRWDFASSTVPFKHIDGPLASFLDAPHMQPAVQFSCAVSITGGEERLTQALESRRDGTALLALGALLYAHAPSTVEQQSATLARLKKARPKWSTTLAAFERRFDAKVLAAAIQEQPPLDERYGHVPVLEWSIRAVGVRQHKEALPRLATLCISDHLHTSLTAERSIEDFRGPEADAALATCLEGWQYNAADRAFEALRERDPALARATLLALPEPAEDERRRYTNALVKVADASAVPRLLQLVPDLDRPGRAIVALEEHAQPRHRAAVRGLIPQVDVLYRERLQRLADKLSPG